MTGITSVRMLMRPFYQGRFGQFSELRLGEMSLIVAEPAFSHDMPDKTAIPPGSYRVVSTANSAGNVSYFIISADDSLARKIQPASPHELTLHSFLVGTHYDVLADSLQVLGGSTAIEAINAYLANADTKVLQKLQPTFHMYNNFRG